MKITSAQFRLPAIATVLSVVLAGCASTTASEHPMRGASTGTSDARGGMQGQQGMPMDMKAMCDKHRQEMAGKSPQERQAMMDEHMRSMSPEMRARMQSMMEQCR